MQLLLSQAIAKYFDFNYQLSERTRRIYREHLERLCQALDDPPLASLDQWQLAKFFTQLTPKKAGAPPYSPGYKDQIYRTLSTFFNFWVEQGQLQANPLTKVKRPQLVSGPKPRLSLKQVERLLDTVKQTDLGERNLAIVLLMVDCGLRLGEVVALRQTDLDLDEKTMHIYAAKKQKWRDVPMSDMAHLAVTAYLEKRPAFTLPTEPLFLNGGHGPSSGQPLTGRAVQLLMRRLKKRLGFNLYAHLLRHTFGNHYIRVGGLKYLQKILGHSRISTTADFYTDPDYPDLQREHRTAAPSVQIQNKLSTKHAPPE